MALTMTRTRTQTALAKLAGLVADLHGELAYIEALPRDKLSAQQAAGIERRRVEVAERLNAVYGAVRQFDPDIDPACIGQRQEWRKALGKKCSERTFLKRYLAAWQNA